MRGGEVARSVERSCYCGKPGEESARELQPKGLSLKSPGGKTVETQLMKGGIIVLNPEKN